MGQIKKWPVLVIFITIVFSLSAFSQQYSIVEKDSARSLVPAIQMGFFDNEVMTIEGFVTRWEREEYRTTILYWIRNYWGDVIIVRTPDGHPEVNKAYRVTGTVSVFPGRDQQRYLDERRREVITDQEDIARSVISRITRTVGDVDQKWWLDASAALTSMIDARGNLNAGNYQDAISAAENAERLALNAPHSNLFYLVVAAGVILFILIIFLIILLVRKPGSTTQEKPVQQTATPSTTAIPRSDSIPEPSEVITGKTVKIHQPPEQTLKVLPGRFEIVEGEPDIKEIRFFKLPDQTDGEYTFGRIPGAPYRHIQIKDPTVSRDQAKLLFSNGKYTIINRADPNKSNSTLLNDHPMGINEVQELKDGDKITMGVVSMVFRNG